MNSYIEMSRATLRALCAERGLSHSGTKEDLATRLDALDASEAAEKQARETEAARVAAERAPSPEDTARVLGRAAHWLADTLRHPTARKDSEETVASRVARRLNKEGFRPEGRKHFTCVQVLALFATMDDAGAADESAPADVEAQG